MAKKIILGTVFIVIAALLQSTVISRLTPIRVVPDIALCILVFIAYTNGAMTGQLTGFFSGILLDFLSFAPLGLNTFIRTLVGAITGFIKDTFFLDTFFLPMALCAGATIFKAMCLFLLHLIFPETVPSYTLLGFTFLIELGMNTLLAPAIFAFLRLFKFFVPRQREES